MSPSSVMVGRLDAAICLNRPLAPHLAQQQQQQPSSSKLNALSTNNREIDLIFTDVDGTLLNSKQELTSKVELAVSAAAAAGVPLVVATGKALGPWTDRILPRLDTRMPQIFIQGLLVRDYEEGIIYQRLLEEEILQEAIDFAEEHNLSLTAYCGDRIVCKTRDEHTDRLIFYGEPTPEGIGPLHSQIGVLPIMKVIFMAPEERITAIRPAAERTFSGRAALTAAIPGMLEVLPSGASKGAGVEWLLERLGIDPERCMGIGDGENDVEMLRLCGLGVAVGNAGAAARAAADVMVASNDEDGVAEAIGEFVLKPRGLSLHSLKLLKMKFFSAYTMGLALALLACTACATSEPTEAIDPGTLVAALERLGADSDFSVFYLPGVDAKSLIAADKLTLAPLPVVEGTPNEDARAIFSWLATDTHIVWKLSLFDIEDFTGAHLHLNTPAGPIVQHLVPERSEGDFIDPIDIPNSQVYVGYFGTSELQETLGVTSIRQFIREYISQNEIYINVHGPETAAILRGFLNA
ncbi:putative Endoribonuclease YBEY, chloroplastic [Nannochloris sp. 'desiccata']|nr:putative Endoribonuclease YBEY, chloroplastic [Chlorella desiccata (nom. nud.)]